MVTFPAAAPSPRRPLLAHRQPRTLQTSSILFLWSPGRELGIGICVSDCAALHQGEGARASKTPCNFIPFWMSFSGLGISLFKHLVGFQSSYRVVLVSVLLFRWCVHRGTQSWSFPLCVSLTPLSIIHQTFWDFTLQMGCFATNWW